MQVIGAVFPLRARYAVIHVDFGWWVGWTRCGETGILMRLVNKKVYRGCVMFWMPRAIYIVLPYGYIVVGLWAMLSLQAGVGTVSGLLLAAAGAWIWMMRGRRRAARYGSFGTRPRPSRVSIR